MKYLGRFLEKNGLIPQRTTDRNDKNPDQCAVHAYRAGPEKLTDTPCDPLTETTKTVSVVSVSDPDGECPESLAWSPRRPPAIVAEIGAWPIPIRQRWGELCNRLEDEGVPFPESERRAYHRVKAEMQG